MGANVGGGVSMPEQERSELMRELQEEGSEPVDMWGWRPAQSVVGLLHSGGAVRDVQAALFPEARVLYAEWRFGERVAGLERVQHGGLTGLALDETFGVLYNSTMERERGFAYTANLTVDYRAPVPPGSRVVVRAWFDSVEGRKVRLRATASEGREEGAKKFVDASSLFIVAHKGE